MLLEETLPRKKGNALLWAGLGLLIASISATLSATITINTNNRIEFGQGIKYIDACDDWVKITPRAGTGTELDYVKYIDIAGLDTSSCKSTDLTIALYKTGVSDSMPVYANPETQTTVVLNIQSSGGVSYRSPANVLTASGAACGAGIGTSVSDTNPVVVDYCSSDGVYSITFFRPLLLAADVNYVTIQTRNAAMRRDYST